jgi:hypothetical protein
MSRSCSLADNREGEDKRPVDVARMIIKHKLECHCSIDHVTTHCVHNTLHMKTNAIYFVVPLVQEALQHHGP